ncbi:MAG: SDR family oxidoreductase [Lactobacillus sp.]|nr:SDR family oxidoreductase [Lactobacillus sp.]
MKVFIVGATGRVATELIKDLVAKGHQITAAARKPENVVLKDDPLVTTVKLDLHASVEELATLIGKQDVIYFTAGSRGKDLLQADAFGAVKTMQAAEQNGIKRYIMLSSMHALEPEFWHEGALAKIMDYNIAKFFADNYLIHNTSLDYTILQPAVLVEEPGTGKITVGKEIGKQNSIADVASTLAELLERDNTRGKVILMSSGTTPIAQALASI